MRITKFGHACVRIEYDDSVIVIDPGMFTAPEAVDGADAVLVTHEHPDHVLPDHLDRAQAPVFTIADVAAAIGAEAPAVAERTTAVRPGESFTAAGVPVTAVNEMHEVIHPEIPRIHNSGYLLDVGGTLLFHPGDSLDGPGRAVDVLFLPVSAPWARSRDLIDFARRVEAPVNLAVHDRVYSEAGSRIFDSQLTMFLSKTGQDYTRLADGEDL